MRKILRCFKEEIFREAELFHRNKQIPLPFKENN
jgi:hypothetical protein